MREAQSPSFACPIWRGRGQSPCRLFSHSCLIFSKQLVRGHYRAMCDAWKM
jgi:hypothetical protein